MSDLISREKAIDAVYEHIRQIGYEHNQSVRSIIQAIVDLPSAEPVRHAKLLNAHPYGECSNCGYLIDIREEFNYCPNCGYRIDKK